MTATMSEKITALAQPATLPWLAEFREEAKEKLADSVWPNQRAEHWLHTPVSRLEKPVETDEDANYQLPELADTSLVRLVFNDGQFDEKASDTIPANVIIFSKATDAETVQIKAYLGSVCAQAENRSSQIFATASDSLIEDGVFIYVPKNTRMAESVLVQHKSSKSDCWISQRIVVVLESGAQARVIEQFLGNANMMTSVSELVVGDNANLHYSRLGMEQGTSRHIGGVHVALERDARLHGFVLEEGSFFRRTDLHIQHRGEGSQSYLGGLYLPASNDFVDLHTCIEHRVPNCESHQMVRGILADKSRAVFNGRIHIHRDAQKTQADLSNKNLLLDKGSEVYTKPELEIYADDVRCSHGATVSQIDDKALYYLQSRGISRPEAEVMLSYGFLNEMLDAIDWEPLQDYLRPLLAKRLTGDARLTRHIL